MYTWHLVELCDSESPGHGAFGHVAYAHPHLPCRRVHINTSKKAAHVHFLTYTYVQGHGVHLAWSNKCTSMLKI